MATLPSAPSTAAPPISQQMEQIDQQIVALLQDIDEAFSNLHQTIATRLIPTVKRLNQNAAPTREFAKFWRQFFELAANTRVPDAFSYNEHPSQSSADRTADDIDVDGFAADRSARQQGSDLSIDLHARSDRLYDEDDEADLTLRLASAVNFDHHHLDALRGRDQGELTAGEQSFLAGLDGLGSSTPLVRRQQQQQQPAGQPRLHQSEATAQRHVKDPLNISRIGEGTSTGEGSTSFGQSLPDGAHIPPSTSAVAGGVNSGGRREAWDENDDDDIDSPDASFAEAYSLDDYAAEQDAKLASSAGLAAKPASVKQPAPIASAAKPPAAGTTDAAKPLAPRLGPSASAAGTPGASTPRKASMAGGRGYTGLTDLGKTPLSTSKATGRRTFGFAPDSRASSIDRSFGSSSSSSDDDDGAGYADYLPPGMSPPVTMNFTLPPLRGGSAAVIDRLNGGSSSSVAAKVVQGALRQIGEEHQRVADERGLGLYSVNPHNAPLAGHIDNDDDDEDDSFDQTFEASAAPSAVGTSASHHSYLSGSHQSYVSGAGSVLSASSAAGANQSFDSDDDSDDSSDDDSLDGGRPPYVPNPQPPLHQHQQLPPPRPSPAPYNDSRQHDDYPQGPPVDLSAISFNPNLTANDSLFAPLPPIPYPTGYASTSSLAPTPLRSQPGAGDDEDDDTLASMDDPFNNPRRPASGSGRPGFGLYGTEGEMYTFNGGRLEDAAPTESPTPFVPDPKRY